MSTTVIAESRDTTPSATMRWYVLVIMCLIYAINIADRYVVSTVLEPIRLELQLTDAGVAFLTGVPLALFYVTFGIPISWLADRSNRRNILALSLIVWSGFTALCGLSRNYWQLLAGRIGVGVGEAGGTPPCNAIVADYFSPERRPMALGVFALGAPIGAWLGADIAGAIAQDFGWRASFLGLGIPGIVMGAVVYLTVREPARGGLDASAGEGHASVLQTLRTLWRQRAAFHIVMASGVCALWGWGLIWWTPTFLMRTYQLNVGEAGAVTGHVHLVGGMIATAGTAWWLSRPAMTDPRRIVWLLAAGVGLATVPSFLAYWTHSLAVAKLMFWIFIPAIYFYIGPCMGLLQNLAPFSMRAMFTAWSLLVGNLFNLIVAPQAVGFMSDRFAGAHGADAVSLRSALLVLAPTGLWAVWHFLMAAKTVVADQERATGFAPRLARPGRHAPGSAPPAMYSGENEMKRILVAALFACGLNLAASATTTGVKVLNTDASWPEGPVWYDGKLYYVEYGRSAVTVWDGHTNKLFWSQPGCGQSAVINTRRHDFLATCYDNGTIGRFDSTGRTLPAYTHDKDGNSFAGPNDFAPDGAGGIYFTASGDVAHRPVTDGKVFYIAPDETITQEAADLQNANGIAVSKDGKILYVVETDAHRLLQFDIGANGSLSGRRVFVNLDDLTGHRVHIFPDGVKIDSRGEIYIGQSPEEPHAPLAGTIFVVDSNAHLKRTLVLPSLQVPNFAFSPDERTLYVTGVDGLKPPYEGKLYSIPNR